MNYTVSTDRLRAIAEILDETATPRQPKTKPPPQPQRFAKPEIAMSLFSPYCHSKYRAQVDLYNITRRRK